jgi:hypothetical protein
MRSVEYSFLIAKKTKIKGFKLHSNKIYSMDLRIAFGMGLPTEFIHLTYTMSKAVSHIHQHEP